MKPFYDKDQFKQLSSPATSCPKFVPNKSISYGVEFRTGRDIGKRGASLFISSGRWAEMQDDGLIDQEIIPGVIGESIDLLDILPFNDQNERKTAQEVLTAEEIIQGQTIDYEGETTKDGRITIFNISPRGYIAREEIPFSSRGFKANNETILGYSEGQSFNPFLDGGDSSLGISREGFYGKSPKSVHVFEDKTPTDGLGYEIDTGDYNEEYQVGARGFELYSSRFGTDSVAFAGLIK